MTLLGLSVLAQQGMALACEKIMRSWGEAYIIDTSQRLTGQDWFDAYRSPRRRASCFAIPPCW